jgi:hypothetical protein
MRRQTIVDDPNATVPGDLATRPGGSERYLLSLAARLEDSAAALDEAHQRLEAEIIRREAGRCRRLGLVTDEQLLADLATRRAD